MLLGRLLELLSDHLQGLVPVGQLARALLEILVLPVERALLGAQPLLLSLDLLPAGTEALLRLPPQGPDLVLRFDERLAGQTLGLPLRLEHHLLGPARVLPGMSDGLRTRNPIPRRPPGRGPTMTSQPAASKEKAERGLIRPCSAGVRRWAAKEA
jgi:hypothetical protein